MSITYHNDDLNTTRREFRNRFIKISVKEFTFWLIIALVIGFTIGMEYSSWQIRRGSASEDVRGTKAEGPAGFNGDTDVPGEIVSSDLQGEPDNPAPTVNLFVTHYRSKSYDKNTAANKPLGYFQGLALSKRMNICGIAAISPGPNPVAKDWYERVKTGDYPVVEIMRDDPGGEITAGRYLIVDRTADWIENTLDIYTGTEDVGYLYAYPSDVTEVTE